MLRFPPGGPSDQNFVTLSADVQHLLDVARTIEDCLAALVAMRLETDQPGSKSGHPGHTGSLSFRFPMTPPARFCLAGDGMDIEVALAEGSVTKGELAEADRKLIELWYQRIRPVVIGAFHAAMTADLILQNVSRVVSFLPSLPEDEEVSTPEPSSSAAEEFNELRPASEEPDGGIPVGTWRNWLSEIVADWQETGAMPDAVTALPLLLETLPFDLEGDDRRLIVEPVRCLFLLSRWMLPDREDEDIDDLMISLRELARLMEIEGQLGLAANLAAAAAHLGRPSSPETQRTAKEGMRLAAAVGNRAQRANCHATYARAVAIAAGSEPARLKEAFSAVEDAIEGMAVLSPGHRAGAAGILMDAFDDQPMMGSLGRIVAHFALPGELPPSVWQKRVQRMPANAWLQRIVLLYGPGSPWFQVEDARAALEPAGDREQAVADWNHWTIDHHAYRHVIPHHRSFLRERDFDLNLLVLTHEVTHVLSFLGGIGIVLTSMRAAALIMGLASWLPHAGPKVEGSDAGSLFARHGLAPLRPNDAAALLDVLLSLELATRIRVVQDVWAPWLEGLAVFGETSADPLQDDRLIDPVNDALLNLVDFERSVGEDHRVLRQSGAETAEARRKLLDEFQARSAAAVRQRGAERLLSAFRVGKTPYLTGYLAVRAVCASWRKTLKRRINGTEIFRALLHATRYDLVSSVPNLDLPLQDFTEAAAASMAGWVRRLSALSADDIEIAIQARADDNDATAIHWIEGRPRLANEDESTGDRVIAELRKRIDEALKSKASEHHGTLAGFANQLLVLGSFLPIGRMKASFHLCIDPVNGSGRLLLLLRTTEHHMDGGSSMNVWGTSLSPESAEHLAGLVERGGPTRMEVTRVIDLAGIATKELGVSGWHLFAVRCDDWFELRGATVEVQALLDARPELAKDLAEIVRMRLYPEGLVRAERDHMASGRPAARQAIDWIDQSRQWELDGEPVDAMSVVEQVRTMAEALVSESVDQERRRKAMSALASAVLSDEALALRLSGSDFWSLTAEAPDQRRTIATALFQTAHGDGDEDLVQEAVAALGTCGCNFFVQHGHGWDVMAN